MKVSRKLGRRSRRRRSSSSRRTLRPRVQKHTHKRGKRFHRGGVNSPVLLTYKKISMFSFTEETKSFAISLIKSRNFTIILERVDKPLTLYLDCGSLTDNVLKLPDLSNVAQSLTQGKDSYNFSFPANLSVFNIALVELQTAHQLQRATQQQQQQQTQQQKEQQTQQQQQIGEAVVKMKKFGEDLIQIPDDELIIGLPGEESSPVNFSVFKKTQQDLANSIKTAIDALDISSAEKEVRKSNVDEYLDRTLKKQKKLMEDTYLLVNGYDKIPAGIRSAVAEKLYNTYLVDNLVNDTPEDLASINQMISSMQEQAIKETVINMNAPDKTFMMNPLYESYAARTVPVPPVRTPPGCTTQDAQAHMRSYGSLKDWVPCDQPPIDTTPREHYGYDWDRHF